VSVSVSVLWNLAINLLALQPHSRGLQRGTAWQSFPAEGVRSQAIVADGVHVTLCAAFVPESAAGDRGAVGRRPAVVVTVVRAEHPTVAVAERVVARVARVPVHLQPVLGRLFEHSERAVRRVVPLAGAARLQVELELVAVGQRQVTEQLVAEPVVAVEVVETDLVLAPRPVEEVRSVDLLLYQQRNAACCTQDHRLKYSI